MITPIINRLVRFRNSVTDWAPELMAGLFLAMIASAFVCMMAGESPLHVSSILYHSTFGSIEELGLTLFYFTPLVFTGLSVALAFRVGLFNIGAEGQLYMGALFGLLYSIAIGKWVNPDSVSNFARFVMISGAFASCMLGGGLWASIPSILKVKRGTHEVITSIMFNYIALGITAYFILHVFPTTESQAPQSVSVPEFLQLHSFAMFDGSAVTVGTVIAIVLAILLQICFTRTKLGFQLRSVGENEVASMIHGIGARKIKIWTFIVSGMIAGCVGFVELYGNAFRFKVGFSPDYGFLGIAVALLARGSPIGVLASAFFFAFIHKGSAELDLETNHMTRDFSTLVEALMLMGMIVGRSLISFLRRSGWFALNAMSKEAK